MFNNDDTLRLLNQAGLQAIYSNIQAGCGLDCDACVGDLAGVEEFTLIPGDIYIVGEYNRYVIVVPLCLPTILEYLMRLILVTACDWPGLTPEFSDI